MQVCPSLIFGIGLALSPAERIRQRFSCSALELVHCTAPFVASTVWMHSLLVAPGQRARCGAVGDASRETAGPPAPLAQPLMVIVADRSDTVRARRKGCGKTGDGGERWTDKAETATARCVFDDIKKSLRFLSIKILAGEINSLNAAVSEGGSLCGSRGRAKVTVPAYV